MTEAHEVQERLRHSFADGGYARLKLRGALQKIATTKSARLPNWARSGHNCPFVNHMN
ncbi:hypothetical protein GOL32_28840 [Sinorhizobium medicae]|nr:hypothetical protein [Sinorhizobium medicae]